MPLFVSSVSEVKRHSVFALERKPPTTLKAQGTSCVAIVGQFPWGPVQQVYVPSNPGDALNAFAPPGFDRTGPGYLALTGKAYPTLRVVGVKGVGAVKAHCNLASAVPTTIAVLTAKYAGIAGNQIVAEVTDADDADDDHFNLSVTITGASGTTSETVKNINFSGTGPDSTFNLSKSKLIGSITKSAAGRPENGVVPLTGGTSPAVVSSDYVGTAGTGDKGIALLEGFKEVRHVAVDDCGSSLRAAVNTAGVAHAEQMGDRLFYMNGDSGLTGEATRADVLDYSSKQAVYLDPWYFKQDDIDGTLRLVPPGPLGASVAANTSPSTSIAWKDPEQRAKLREVNTLESNRGDQAGDNTDAGIVTIIPEETGGFSFESGHLTSYLAEASTGDITRTRMAIYIVTAFTAGVRPLVDSPSVKTNQNQIIMALAKFLGGLKKAQISDPNHTPHIADYGIGAADTVNTQDSIDAGEYYVPADVKTSPAMEKIGLSLAIGPTVAVLKASL